MTTTELSKSVTLETRGPIALLWTDNPPVNAISSHVAKGIYAGLEAIEKNAAIKAVVIICRGSTFFSGADITEFGTPESFPTWADADRKIDHFAKPVIAAIHTRAFGGGFEIALVSNYRIAERTAQFAFPEVGLGIIPGWGGTQRFPRVAGFPAALDIITTARVFPADEALKLGAIDKVVEPGNLEAEAIAFANEIIAKGVAGDALPRARTREEHVEAARKDPSIFAKAREATAKRYRGFKGRLVAIDIIENALRVPFEEALKAEMKMSEDLIHTPEHRALSGLFFAEREARRVPDLPKGTPVRKVKSVAVIGGGTMGRGITLAFADRGFPVRLIEVSEPALEKAMGYIRAEIEGQAKKGRIPEAEAKARIGRIEGAVGTEKAAGADLVIEAVFENLDLKKKIFSTLDRIMQPGAILASNTSGLDVNQMAEATTRPGDVIGMHFFSPANIMKLFEIVRGDKTSPEVLASALEVAKQIGKQPVVSRVCDGFIANRAFENYWREAEFMVEEGANPYEIDRVLNEFGMPMGAFAVADLSGLDLGQDIRKASRPKLPQGARICYLEDAIVAKGRFGQKNGKGWYDYSANPRAGAPDPEIEAIIAAYRKEKGITPRKISNDEIIERTIYAVVNEGAKELEDGTAIRASDIDVASVYGMGFPSWRGGPMQYADEVGLKTVAAAVERFYKEQGYWWQPSKLLLEMAAAGKKFNS
jgi:3-hydroxyacyl-CoA dehydrogenase